MLQRPRLDLRPSVSDPVILLISRREVEACDVGSVVSRLKAFVATREDAWNYKGQMTLVVAGYEHDPRELVDIGEVRDFLRGLETSWPYWAYFFSHADASISLFLSCVAGKRFLGGGRVELDPDLVAAALRRGMDGISSVFDKFGFPERELRLMSDGLIEVVLQAATD